MGNLRISGIASGMDIDKMVSDLMKAERMPLDKLKQKKQVLEWQRDDYRSMNTLLLNFRTDLSAMKMTTKYRARTTASTNEAQVTATATSAASQGSYSISNVTQLATAATLKNSGALSDAANGKKIDLNKQLFASQTDYQNQTFSWKSGSVESMTIKAASTGQNQTMSLDPALTLVDLSSMNVEVNGKSFDVVTDPTAALTANQVYVDNKGQMKFGTALAVGSTINVDYFTDKKIQSFKPSADTTDFQLAKGSINSINSLTVKLDATQTDTYTIDPASTGTTKDLILNGGGKGGTIDTLTGKITLNKAVTSTQQVDVDYTQNYTTFSVASYTSNGLVKENFGIQGSDTMNQVISKVNGSNAGVTMFYDSFSDRMTLTRKETGNFNGSEPVTDNTTTPPTITPGDPEILTSGSFIDDVLKFKTVVNGGTAVETGGQDSVFTVNGLTTKRHTNTFDMNGVTFSLKQTFTDPVNVTINNDTNSVFDNIKGFIDKYNTLIDTIQKKLSEEHYRDYPPLTDDQKQQLSDKQQEQWEEKAKSGLLRQDSILNGVLNQMRSSFYSPVTNSQVNSAYNQLAKVGITTSANYLEGGKLQIDDAKLKAAIQADPTSVENLFRGTGTTSSDQGVIQRLYDNVTDTMDSLKQKAGNTFSTNKKFAIGLKLDSLGTQITSFEGRMKQVEDRYYRQFTAMEQAMQKANSQASYMQQQFSGGQ